MQYIDYPELSARVEVFSQFVFYFLSLIFDGFWGVSFLISIVSVLYFFSWKLFYSRRNLDDLALFFAVFFIIIFPYVAVQVRFGLASAIALLGLSIVNTRPLIGTITLISSISIHLSTIPFVLVVLILRVINYRGPHLLVLLFGYALLTTIFIFSKYIFSEIFVINSYYLSYLEGAFNSRRLVLSLGIYALLFIIFIYGQKKYFDSYLSLIPLGFSIYLYGFISGDTFVYKVGFPFLIYTTYTVLEKESHRVKPFSHKFAILSILFIAGFFVSLYRLNYF